MARRPASGSYRSQPINVKTAANLESKIQRACRNGDPFYIGYTELEGREKRDYLRGTGPKSGEWKRLIRRNGKMEKRVYFFQRSTGDPTEKYFIEQYKSPSCLNRKGGTAKRNVSIYLVIYWLINKRIWQASNHYHSHIISWVDLLKQDIIQFIWS